MYDYLSSEKYILLRNVVQLWLLVVGLLILTKYHIPNRVVHNSINVLLALATVAEFVAIVVISVRYVF